MPRDEEHRRMVSFRSLRAPQSAEADNLSSSRSLSADGHSVTPPFWW